MIGRRLFLSILLISLVTFPYTAKAGEREWRSRKLLSIDTPKRETKDTTNYNRDQNSSSSTSTRTTTVTDGTKYYTP